MLSKHYESTYVDSITWLHVPSGTHWSTSSDTHQVVKIYKRSKGPHNVNMSTMCHLFDGSARVAIFVYWSARKTQTW